MSTKSLVFFFLAVMTPVIGQAQVQIKLDPTIKVHVVNEAPAEQYLSAQQARLELPNGEHQLVIEKVVRLRDAADESFLDSSDALILLFNASDEQLTLETPAVDTRYELKTFNRKPKAYLLDANGNKKDLKIDTLIKEGFQLDRNYIAEIQAYNQTESKAALEENQSEPAYTFDESNKGASVNGQIVQQEKADQKIVSQMLEYWYQKADEQTQQRFKSWINQTH